MRVATDVICLLEGRAVLADKANSLTAAQVENAYFGTSGVAGGEV
jgi:hypothetical protein